MITSNFTNILKTLKKINKNMPDLRFGEVVQLAIDENQKSRNVCMEQLTDKKILICLNNYYLRHKKQRENGNKKR